MINSITDNGLLEVDMKLVDSNNKIYFLSLFIISTLIISACASEVDSTRSQGNETVESVSIDEEAVSPNQPETEIPASPTRVSDVEYTLGYDLGGPDLRATGPRRVNFASGEIQLVEFFAYW